MQIWETFLQSLDDELGSETVNKWLRTLKMLKFDAGNLYLEAKDSFQSLWFEEHIRAKAQAKLVTGNNKKIKVHLSISNASPVEQKSKYKAKSKEGTQPPFQLNFDSLDDSCTFDQFIVSEENVLAHKLLSEVTGVSKLKENQLGVFNPIYLYGTGGAGKTHLLMSIAHSLEAKGLKFHYVRAETFTDHVVSAIRAGEMSLFRQAYRNIDVLLVDGVHVFSRKGATQEEFFHTFNTLHLAGKQIILSANCSPQELQLIEPRLVSRFEWGIVLPLKTLSKIDDIKKMLLSKAAALQFPLTEKLIDFLMETFTSSPKALMKALNALIFRLHLDTRNHIGSLSIVAAKTLLTDLIAEEEKSALTPKKIIQGVAEQYGIRTEDILGKAQTKECTLPRQLAMYLCRQQLKIPYIKIGDLFGRDHSTVMSSIKRIQKAVDLNDAEIINASHAIQKRFISQ
jgi:chromosomal replication initiator protein